MPLYYIRAITCCVLLLTTAPARPEQPAQPQFKSSELQVTANRAKRNAAGQLVVSLLFNNVSQENLAIYGSGGTEATTETGDVVVSSETKGLPVCTVDCNLTNAIVGVYVDPVVVERGNSLATTLIFPSDTQSTSCSLDLTMRIYVARLAQISQPSNSEKWHLVPVSLTNIQAC
jgi:hypothetical protein